MAQCVEKVDKRPADLAAKDVIVIDDLQPKKLKQARLPFQPLDCKTPSPSPSGAISKKRKLSGQDSLNSNSKQARHGPSNISESAEEKLPTLDNENEVSSSSEAENVPGSSKPTKNILERFVRRSALQEEITSTNDVIDLTNCEEMALETDENSPVKMRSPTKSAKKTGGKSGENSASKKQKPEDGFARKLNFDEKKKPTISQGGPSEETSGEAAKETDIFVDEEMKAVGETGPIDSDDKRVEEPALIDLGQENGEAICNNTSGQEEKSDKSVVDVSSPDKSESENLSSDTPSVKKKRPLSSSTPRTPAKANTSCSSADGSTPNSTRKYGQMSTGKQAQKAEMRQKVKEDKEKEKLEAKEKKEKERLEQKQKREAEKAEKLRQKHEEKEMKLLKEKERLEKKEQLEKEKQEKLKKREEEKKQKQDLLDAKQEEKKKKDEEKRLKEEEKQKEDEEKERQKQRRKEAFQSFFLKPKAVTTKVPKVTDCLFIPFEVKKDMSLAPGCRRSSLTNQEKDHLDKALAGQGQDMMYVDCLKKGIVKPVSTGRKLRTKIEAEQEVELMVHDSETVKKVMHAVKLLQFHKDYRPPYYGTWRKAPKHISPRNPWKKDEAIFDYEVDSDDEWEEEEPGESLSDSNDEDEEGDGGGEEEEDDGWMVPHGYLSEDEGCEDDEEVTPEVLKARQRAKAQAWEAELQAKKQVAPPVHIGCYWHSVSALCQKDLDILRQFEMVCFRALPLATQLSCPTMSDLSGEKSQDKTSSGATPSAKGCRKRAVPEEAMPDLIRLLHGNSFGIKKLVREFRLYWRRKTSGLNVSLNESHLDEEEAMDTSCVDTSIVQRKDVASIQGENGVVSLQSKETAKQSEPEEKQEADKSEDAKEDTEADDNFCISKRQLELKILAIAAREKRPGINKKCWYVSGEALQQYNMTDIPTENTWEYVSHDMTRKTPCKSAEKKKEKKAALTNSDARADEDNDDQTQVDKPKKSVVPKAPKDQPSIVGFTCKASQEKTEGNTPATQFVESTTTKSTQNSDTPNKAATKTDKPSVLDLLKKAPAKKASRSREDKTKNPSEISERKTENLSKSNTETPMEEDCSVLD